MKLNKEYLQICRESKVLQQWRQAEQDRLKRIAECKHEWKSKFDFVYDYDHQDCHKCGASRMV